MSYHFRNVSIYSVSGSLFLIRYIHSCCVATSMIVEKVIYPYMLYVTVNFGLSVNVDTSFMFEGPLTNDNSMWYACPGTD